MHPEERVVITGHRNLIRISPNLHSKTRHSHLQDAHHSFLLYHKMLKSQYQNCIKIKKTKIDCLSYYKL